MGIALTTQTSKIQYLDGIRGLAALNVLLTHLVVAFYPALYNGNAEQVHLFAVDEVAIAKSFWTVFYAGNMAVPLLFILSAFVLSLPFFKYRDVSFATAGAYRRYLRLEAPVLTSLLFAWLLLHFGLNYNREAAAVTQSNWLSLFFQYEPSFWGAMRQGLWECFSPGGNVSYNPVLWTMNFELLGSFSVFGFMALFGKSPRRYVVYIAMAAVFVRSYYFAFVIGMVLCDLYCSEWGESLRRYLFKRQWISWACLLMGCLPTLYFGENRNAWDTAMNMQALRDWGMDLYAFYHISGAALLFFACLHNRFLQQVLSGRLLQFFGRIAFSLYLLHLLLLCSVGCFVFLTGQKANMSYGSSVALAALATTAAAVFLAWLMTKFIDEPAAQLVRKVQKKYFY